jgi:hypothetical protein
MRPSAANRERRFFGVAHKVRYSDEPHLISYVTAVRHAYSGAGRCEYELLTVLQISFGVNVWEAGARGSRAVAADLRGPRSGMMLAIAPDSAALTGSRPGESGNATARSAADRARLSVEFFGAAGAGKTTIAMALAANLRMQGLPVRLVQFGRASTRGVPLPPRGGLPVSAEWAKLAGGLRALVQGGRHDPTLRKLLALLPPGDRIREIRIRRYAADLGRAWRENQRTGEVLILDQGFSTLLCSMALLSDPIDRSALARGLALVPRADLLIHVDAPRAALEGRLQERVRRRRGFERLFGNEVGLWLRQLEVASVLAEVIAESGRAPVRVQSRDRADLDAAVQLIAREITALVGDMPE